MNYFIHPKVYSHLVKNIKESEGFYRDIQDGIQRVNGKVVLNHLGIQTCENYNLPNLEYLEPLEA